MSSKQSLRCQTYMSPDFPVEYFELLLHYLEDKLNVFTELVYESRWPGPPNDRPNPFSTGNIDIGFVDNFSYLKMSKEISQDIELLPVSSVHLHKKCEGRPGFFADVVAHIDRKDTVKEFVDLRGCKWAYSTQHSISGNLITLQQLKELGENSSFFGTALPSGSDIKSIEMVLNKSADATCVDANVLSNYINRNPSVVDQLFVVASWGMLGPYPIIVKRNLNDNMKSEIASALLEMHKDEKYGPLLKSFHVTKFANNEPSFYDSDVNLLENTKMLSIGSSVYY